MPSVIINMNSEAVLAPKSPARLGLNQKLPLLPVGHAKRKAMKAVLALALALTVTGSLQAQVEILPPDFVLFGMTSGDYCAEYHQQTLPASTNEDYLFPNAGPFSN